MQTTWSNQERDDALREIWKLLRIHAPGFKERYGIARLGLFGSWVQGTAQPWSKVDVLVEWPDAEIYSYVDVKEFLQRVLGRQVDLVLQDQLREHCRDWILASVRYAN